jgi:hypothetical protein
MLTAVCPFTFDTLSISFKRSRCLSVRFTASARFRCGMHHCTTVRHCDASAAQRCDCENAVNSAETFTRDIICTYVDRVSDLETYIPKCFAVMVLRPAISMAPAPRIS